MTPFLVLISMLVGSAFSINAWNGGSKSRSSIYSKREDTTALAILKNVSDLILLAEKGIIANDLKGNASNIADAIKDFLASNGGSDINDNGSQQYGGYNEGLNENKISSNGPSNMYEAISQQDTMRAVPEKIKIWREEQKTRLEKNDSEEEKRKKELKEKAKKELDDWYKHHTEQLEKTKENNRAAETAFVEDRDEKVTGQAWEKITRLCEFNPKNSKNTKDVSRFRSILLQLKQTPLVR
ncbi:clathrin light chain A-like [Physella acuta]|uniref:clathrin light chain A-like n=1 Tax=Physella acuta TaxID=109671 RepID=UPI0027DCA702|nr:clathrin light chain A-like [Physella acuta]